MMLIAVTIKRGIFIYAACYVLAFVSCPRISLAWSLGTRQARYYHRAPQAPVRLATESSNIAFDSNINKEDSLSCPFSMKLPRYRIDLTNVPATKPRQLPLLGGFQAAWTKQQLEKKGYQWISGLSGDLDVFCRLWKTAAKAQYSTSSIRMALPEANARVVRQWVDLVGWIQDYEETEGIPNGNRLAAVYSLELDVPCIEIGQRNTIGTTSSAVSAFDAALIEKQTMSWVQRILVDLSICPFTKSTRMSGQGLADVGVPVGRIAYHTSMASSMILLLADTWQAIADMMAAGAKGRSGVSSILLAAPHYNKNFELWAGPVFAVLEASVVAAGMEKKVGVVCFHPRYATPDGSTFPGFGHMHSVPRLQQWVRETIPDVRLSAQEVAAGGAWQRRTPHATINVLRADQLQAAEGRRNTPQMYTRNICTLLQVGNEKLQTALEKDQTLGLKDC